MLLGSWWTHDLTSYDVIDQFTRKSILVSSSAAACVCKSWFSCYCQNWSCHTHALNNLHCIHSSTTSTIAHALIVHHKYSSYNWHSVYTSIKRSCTKPSQNVKVIVCILQLTIYTTPTHTQSQSLNYFVTKCQSLTMMIQRGPQQSNIHCILYSSYINSLWPCVVGLSRQ